MVIVSSKRRLKSIPMVITTLRLSFILHQLLTMLMRIARLTMVFLLNQSKIASRKRGTTLTRNGATTSLAPTMLMMLNMAKATTATPIMVMLTTAKVTTGLAITTATTQRITRHTARLITTTMTNVMLSLSTTMSVLCITPSLLRLPTRTIHLTTPSLCTTPTLMATTSFSDLSIRFLNYLYLL